MRVYLSAALVLSLAVLGACEPVKPAAGASVGADDPAASVGASSGRLNAGVGTRGAYASADVVDTKNVDVSVGTSGPSARVRVGDSPVKVGWGFGAWRIGI